MGGGRRGLANINVMAATASKIKRKKRKESNEIFLGPWNVLCENKFNCDMGGQLVGTAPQNSKEKKE